MPLPDSIVVRYTEDEAGYVSIRPVVRQAFRLAELVDMVVIVSGKDAARVAQIFRAGTIVYNGYRYWWEGFSGEPREVEALLAGFPSDDPSRAFRAAETTGVVLDSGGGAHRSFAELKREEAFARRFFHRQSAWDVLLEAARGTPPAYEQYSYARRADVYRRSLSAEEATRLLAALFEAAPRGLRARLANLALPSALLYICPRAKAESRDRRS